MEINVKTPRLSFFLGALAGAAIATLVFTILRGRSGAVFSPYAIAPPEGGEKEGEYELFVG